MTESEMDDLEIRISRYVDGEIDAGNRDNGGFDDGDFDSGGREAFESELLRDPEARRLYEGTLDIDEMAHRALREHIASGAEAGRSVQSSTSNSVANSISGAVSVRVFRPWVRVAALLLVTLGAWTIYELSREEQVSEPGSEMVDRTSSEDSRASGSRPQELPVEVPRMLVRDDASPDDFDEILAAGAEESFRREFSRGIPAFTRDTPASTQTLPSGFMQTRGESWTQRRLIGVMDENDEGLYLFELEHTKIRVQPVRLDL